MKDRPFPALLPAFTVRELVVSLALVGVLLTLAALAVPSISCGPVKGRLTQVLSNMKQLHLATQQMTLDSQTAETPPNIRWTCTNGQPLKFTEWTNLLVRNNYLTKEDLTKLLKSPQSNKSTNVFTVYAVGDFDQPETVLLATSNWQGPNATNLGHSPLGQPGFLIFRKGGDGMILQPRQCQKMEIIGTGGKYNFLPLK
jgi:type II secretory pathway pseudopilin PulG